MYLSCTLEQIDAQISTTFFALYKLQVSIAMYRYPINLVAMPTRSLSYVNRLCMSGIRSGAALLAPALPEPLPPSPPLPFLPALCRPHSRKVNVLKCAA